MFRVLTQTRAVIVEIYQGNRGIAEYMEPAPRIRYSRSRFERLEAKFAFAKICGSHQPSGGAIALDGQDFREQSSRRAR